jgi:hypothetical protein
MRGAPPSPSAPLLSGFCLPSCYTTLLSSILRLNLLRCCTSYTYIHGKPENKTAWHNGKWLLDSKDPADLPYCAHQRSRSHDPLWNPTFDGSDSYGDKINSKMQKQSNVVHMSSYQDLILTRIYDQRINRSSIK